METKLTIGERLKDLRVERDLNQKVVESQAGIPSSTLSTYENDTVGNVNVAAIIKLAEFYNVQPEYLLCLTDNKKRPDASIQDLHLSDGTLDILLKDKTLNHRMLCELIEHPGFRQLAIDLEIYVNGLVSDRVRDANAMLEAMRQLIHEQYNAGNDVEMQTLQVGQIVEDEDILNMPIPLFEEAIKQSVVSKVKNTAVMRHQSGHLLEYAKRAVEMAIECGEDTALKWLEDKTHALL